MPSDVAVSGLAVPDHPARGHALTGAHKVAGVLLVVGWLAFWAGAFTPPYRWWFGIPVREFLELVAAHRGVWLFIAAAFAIGVLATAAGLVVLSGLLRPAAPVATDLGRAAFLFGSVLWLSSLAFRATGTISAATDTLATGAVPAWFEPMRSWSGALFAIYMVLAYLAIAAFGRALRAAELAPAWLARAFVSFGLAGAVGFLIRIPVFNPPLMIHLPFGVLGIILLRRPSTPRR